VHRLKRCIHVFRVDGSDDVKRLIRWGVDGIIINDPKLALEIFSEET
jgi:glycerophosphoryl diester phosphodiesterase